ncbi:MAG: hypothetical protein Q9218_006647 [Villophora microphyllina]
MRKLPAAARQSRRLRQKCRQKRRQKLQQKRDEDPDYRALKKLFGNFAKLPPEIRIMVWSYFVPDQPPVRMGTSRGLWRPYQDLPSTNVFAILRVNRRISDEVSYEIYRNKSLRFCLDPWAERWLLLSPAMMPGQIKYAQFSKFSELNIDIIEPDVTNDPGGLWQLMDSAIDLACTSARDRNPIMAGGFILHSTPPIDPSVVDAANRQLSGTWLDELIEYC